VVAGGLLIVHFAIAVFIVLGLPCIWIGAALGWRWVHRFAFRAAHLVAILLVAVESLLGLPCPLTVWEDALRGNATEQGFVQRWLAQLLYYDWQPWIFNLIYAAFALLVIATWWFVPPRHKR
jgi:Protein of Unknown function (DUF2784)